MFCNLQSKLESFRNTLRELLEISEQLETTEDSTSDEGNDDDDAHTYTYSSTVDVVAPRQRVKKLSKDHTSSVLAAHEYQSS